MNIDKTKIKFFLVIPTNDIWCDLDYFRKKSEACLNMFPKHISFYRSMRLGFGVILFCPPPLHTQIPRSNISPLLPLFFFLQPLTSHSPFLLSPHLPSPASAAPKHTFTPLYLPTSQSPFIQNPPNPLLPLLSRSNNIPWTNCKPVSR